MKKLLNIEHFKWNTATHYNVSFIPSHMANLAEICLLILGQLHTLQEILMVRCVCAQGGKSTAHVAFDIHSATRNTCNGHSAHFSTPTYAFAQWTLKHSHVLQLQHDNTKHILYKTKLDLHYTARRLSKSGKKHHINTPLHDTARRLSSQAHHTSIAALHDTARRLVSNQANTQHIHCNTKLPEKAAH